MLEFPTGDDIEDFFETWGFNNIFICQVWLVIIVEIGVELLVKCHLQNCFEIGDRIIPGVVRSRERNLVVPIETTSTLFVMIDDAS